MHARWVLLLAVLAGTAPEGDAAIRRLADWARPKLGLG